MSPALLSGWGVRPYDWQFAASVQQQTAAARVGGVRLQPPLVGQLHLHRQPRRRAAGLRHLHVHGADRLATCRTAGSTISFALLKPSAFGKVDNYLTRAERLRRRDQPTGRASS